MKIIEILPPPPHKKNTTRTFLSDGGKAYTTYDNGRKSIVFNGLTIYEKSLTDGGFGYLQVKIRKRAYMLHRLVAEHFVPNPEHKPVVNHRDMDKRNNTASNLEWVTYSENSHHAASGGVSYVARKKWCRACNLPVTRKWCVEEFDDRQVRWMSHRDIILVYDDDEAEDPTPKTQL